LETTLANRIEEPPRSIAQTLARDVLETFADYAQTSLDLHKVEIVQEEPVPVLLTPENTITDAMVEALANLFRLCGAWPNWIAPALVARDPKDQLWALTGTYQIRAAALAGVDYRVRNIQEQVAHMQKFNYSWQEIACRGAEMLDYLLRLFEYEELAKIAELEDQLDKTARYWYRLVENLNLG
jgi:hypothetical protein